ncbi:hypothetical protein TBLA_0B03390 [Henningerozyma blattae CBS 6284]|uniref:rRNA adenine N(6)-methyltransferase n=1 Tax=Henningerozyma blattae (strain ATCC 34711 / CBS 6284 / DSM 70876 / NBRC 10599 / NRRL Y-10934 / UCD 77-7) TaxID=1071380 RepID=I2GYH8_HENB6|nr:hypothetical protein TBLA_0B03390 [Tetrapisispora blattae CBS 6284]CCH59180.1 hypothetical protein TBLA_0B03390 [Tetrapisispora blattae CBS 6284]
MQLPKFHYGTRHLIDSTAIRGILHNSKVFPRSHVLELYPGIGPFSNEIQKLYNPPHHLLLEPRKNFKATLSENFPNLNNCELDPYDWSTYHILAKSQELNFHPLIQDWSKPNDDLVFVANLTNPHNEGLLMQWLDCITRRNWLYKFGKVPMIIWINSHLAGKLLAPYGSSLRSKRSTFMETLTEISVLAHHKDETYPGVKNHIVETQDSNTKPQEIVEFDDSMIWPIKATKSASSESIVCLKVVPNGKEIDFEPWEFITKHLYMSKITPFKDIADSLGHGGYEYFEPQFRDNQELWNKKPVNMTPKEFIEISNVFMNWPFKPDYRSDFLNIFSEDM